MSRRTEDPTFAWIRRYIFFHGKRHPAEMGAPEGGLCRYLARREHHADLRAVLNRGPAAVRSPADRMFLP